MRFGWFPRCAAAVFVLSCVAAPVAAQDRTSEDLSASTGAPEDASVTIIEADAPVITPALAITPAAAVVAAPRARRPSALVPLYVTFGALQALDVHSTSRALERGAVEANPMMKGVARSEAGMLAMKAAGGAAVVFASEKIWKRHRTGAVIFMAAANSAMGWVVQHNYRVVR